MSYATCDHAAVYPLGKCMSEMQANGRLRIAALLQLHLS